MLPGFEVTRKTQPVIAGFKDREGARSQGTWATSNLEEAMKWILSQSLQKKPRSTDSLMSAQWDLLQTSDL